MQDRNDKSKNFESLVVPPQSARFAVEGDFASQSSNCRQTFAIICLMLCTLFAAKGLTAQERVRETAAKQEANNAEKNRSERLGQRGSENRGGAAINQSSVEREKQAREFVTENHDELNRLLDVLKEQRPREYQRVIRELFRQAQQIENLKQREDTEKHRLTLEIWKVGSRSRVLAAQVMVNDSEEKRQLLKELVRQEANLRAKLLQLDRERIAKRLAAIDAQIAELEKQEAIDERLDSLLNRARSSRKTTRQKNDKVQNK